MNSNSIIKLLVPAILLLGCSNPEKNKSSESEEFLQAKSQIRKDIGALLVDIPPPSEVPYILMSIGADFNSSFVNPTTTDYNNDITKAALNLGVYTADIGYLSAYDKAQESLEYLTTSKDLAETIGLGSTLDLEMLSRFESNLGMRDSLKTIVDDIMNRNTTRLQEMNRLDVIGLVLYGGYIEGLYIANSVIETYPDALPDDVRDLILEPLIKVVIDQSTSLKDLIKVIEGLSEDDQLVAVKEDLQKLQVIFDTDISAVSSAIYANEGELVLTADVLDNLSKEVKRIRSAIIENN